MSGRESSFEMKETSSGGSKRAKSQIRFAVEDTVERHSSNSLDKLQLSNNIGDSGSNPGSFQSSRNNSNSPSNPSANMKRNTLSISKRTLSVSQIQQFQAQQQDKYDTLVLKLGKGFFGAFILLVCTCAFILSKSSLIYMADKANVYGVGYKTEEFGRYIVQILSILMLPLFSTVFSDLMYFWVRETKEKKRDPKAKRVKPHTIMLLAYLEGVIEAVGISIFIMMVLPLEKVDNIAKIFLLNGLCVIPVVSALTMKWKKWLKPQKNIHVSNTQDSIDLTDPEIGFGEKKKKDGVDYCSRLVVTAVQILFLLMQLAGMGLYMYKFGLWWEIPLSLILCSISYWKNYVFIERLEPHWADAYKRNRYATSCVKTIAKITFIFVCVIVIAKVKYSMEPSLYLDHNFVFDSIVESSGLHYSLLGSWVAYYMVWMACLACMQITCFALPVLLTTPLTVFWQTWQCKDYIFGDGAIGTCSGFSTGSLSDTLVIAGGILMWVSFVIVSGHLWAGIDKRDANQLDEDMWAQPETINCLFMEESLALNRNRNPKVVKSLDGEMEYGFHAHRTYITTTMYHESKVEMQKLVMSLLQIDAEIPAEDKIADYYEAHIIFDDAFLKQPNLKPNNFDYSPYYNEWVFYLLEIFQELKLKKLGDAVVVWYGEVLTFKFALGMKLVVHLKDVSKIRQKKRWSQILYMHSILEDVLDDENKIGMLDSNTFILMIDGDTQFTRKSVNLMRFMIELDRERSGAICGRIFPEGASNPVVWYQKFEYAVGHWFQKTAEHVFGSVLCSPGCFSLVRIAALYRRSGENMDGQNCAIETYSKEIESAMDVLKFDQGEDRMLSTLIIKNGWRLQYCAGAEAGTFCPEGFGDFFKQRRRWISSTLANLYFLIASSGDIVKINSSVSPPYILYTAGVFASSIFGPATVVLVVIGGMGYAFNWQGTPSYVLGLGLPLGYAGICIIFNLNMETDTSRKKAKKIDIQVGAAFVLCALYALLMAAVVVGVAAQMVDEVGGPDSIFLFTLIATFVVASTLHGEFFLLTYGIIYLFFLPTMYLILIMFAVANIHDQSWGTRDGSGGGKESDADKFFSISKLGAYIREIKDSFREALYDEQVKKPKKVEEEEDNKFGWRTYGDEGKEEIMILEEERRRIEEEKKKQEEEKKKQEEERKLREIERQKEEARKKKIEADEREKLQERLKQERRRGIHHPYKDHLSALSRRLKNKVATPDKGNDKDVAAEKLERVRQLASLQQMCCFMLFLCSVIWLILVVTVGVHPELKIIETNAVGILFLISFGIIMIFQFLASILHRMETMFNALANIPMTFDCTMVEKGNKYERLIKKQMAQQDEPAPKEGVAAKVARKLLLVDKRTATKANLLN